MSRVMDMVPYSTYNKVIEKVKSQQVVIVNMQSTLIKAKGVLDATLTKSNITNAVIMLELLPSKGFMMKYVSTWIIKSAKSPNSYCSMVKKKCSVTGRIYTCLNKRYNTFDNIPEWFVYETFKEKALSSVPSSFSLRFRDALVAFILNQQKYEERMQKR